MYIDTYCQIYFLLFESIIWCDISNFEKNRAEESEIGHPVSVTPKTPRRAVSPILTNAFGVREWRMYRANGDWHQVPIKESH